MSRTAAKFTQADIARALRAAAQTRVSVAIEVLRDGTIRLVPCEKHDLKAGNFRPKLDEKPTLLLS